MTLPLKDRVTILDETVLSDDWARLTRYRLRYTRADGTEQELVRQAYDRGDGACILPYDPVRGTVLLGRQFRLVAMLGGHDGLLIEAAAGLLDRSDPATRIRAETEEELGLRLREVTQIFDIFMSPGSVTERLHFFVARYDAANRVSRAGACARRAKRSTSSSRPFARPSTGLPAAGSATPRRSSCCNTRRCTFSPTPDQPEETA